MAADPERPARQQRRERGINAALHAANVGDERAGLERVAAFLHQRGHGLDRHAEDDDVGLAHRLARVAAQFGVDAGEPDRVERVGGARVDEQALG